MHSQDPTHLASANVGNEDTPLPLKHAHIFNEWSLIGNFDHFSKNNKDTVVPRSYATPS